MKNKGFTLIELLVVIAIVGILATIVISSLGEARTKSKDTAIVAQLRNMQTSVESVTGATGNYTDICDKFDPGGEFASIRESVENKGGEWESCLSDNTSYSITVTLNSGQVANNLLLINNAFALEKLKEIEIIEDEIIPKNIGVHSTEELLLSDNDIKTLKARAKQDGDKFVEPKYYCVGAAQSFGEIEGFRSGFLYSLPGSGCGSPAGSSDSVFDAYDDAVDNDDNDDDDEYYDEDFFFVDYKNCLLDESQLDAGLLNGWIDENEHAVYFLECEVFEDNQEEEDFYNAYELCMLGRDDLQYALDNGWIKTSGIDAYYEACEGGVATEKEMFKDDFISCNLTEAELKEGVENKWIDENDVYSYNKKCGVGFNFGNYESQCEPWWEPDYDPKTSGYTGCWDIDNLAWVPGPNCAGLPGANCL